MATQYPTPTVAAVRSWSGRLLARLGLDQPPDPSPEPPATPTPLAPDDVNAVQFEQPGAREVNVGQTFLAFGLIDAGAHSARPGPVHGLNRNPETGGAGWTFVRARFLADAPPRDDRYFARLTIPQPGDYLLAFRFSVNQGQGWLYADMTPDKKRFSLDEAARGRVRLKIDACAEASAAEMAPSKRSTCVDIDPPAFVEGQLNLLPAAWQQR